MVNTDSYIQLLKRNDEGAAILQARTADTLKNNEFVDILQDGKNGIAVLKGISSDYDVLVHSKGNNKDIGLVSSSRDLIEELAETALMMGARPIGFGNVVDANVTIESELEQIAKGYNDAANSYGVAILNGELAELGSRIPDKPNLVGTMISIIPKRLITPIQFQENGTIFSRFDHKGLPLYINCDGIGTKTEIYERANRHEMGVFDFMAMDLDDAIKLGADVKVISGLLEYNGDIPFKDIQDRLRFEALHGRILGALQAENVGANLASYKMGVSAFNISGSVVSTIDEERLRNPPKPKENDYLIALKGARPNPRSNGISALRAAAEHLYGKEWHTTEGGIHLLEFMAEPSVVFYSVFKDLINSNLASSVYHMSGGAHDSKLSKPIAKEELYGELEGIFNPDERQIVLMNAHNDLEGLSIDLNAAYKKWPMGNDGYITSSNPTQAIKRLNEFGLEAKIVSQLKKHDNLVGIRLEAYDGSIVDYAMEKAI